MKDFSGRIAVVTGGGTGMGRELCIALARDGCHIATCDVSAENMEKTRALAEAAAPGAMRFSTHLCDVSDEAQVLAFRAAVAEAHDTDQIHLLFNNAGIGGGGSITDPESRDGWDKTFEVCWNGVYYCTRAFIDMLMAADAGHIINTSSINGFWACMGPNVAHSAYSAAKFAVKGFTEALISDLRVNAPHVKCSVVMPGHIGTQIVGNSMKFLQQDADSLTAEDIAGMREGMVEMGLPVGNLPDEDIRNLLRMRAAAFEESAPMTAAQAVDVILDGVRHDRWRIIVGEDGVVLDAMVRADPENAYEPEFLDKLFAQGHLNNIINVVGGAGDAAQPGSS